jgi:hypothetical protein
MGGSLEAFQLFNALAKADPAPKSTSSSLSITPNTAATSVTEASSTASSVSNSSLPIIPETTASSSATNTSGNEGLKMCLASVGDYTRRQQSLREVEERLSGK